jgi:hypothetical protein
MGQYYLPTNINKREYLDAHTFGDGLKLLEFGLSGMGLMSGLAILLADGNGRGGGDINEDPVSEIVGRWAGDRIVIAGDYADNGRFVKATDVEGFIHDKTKKPLTRRQINLYNVARKKYKDISFDVIFALMADSYVRKEWMKSVKENRSFNEKRDEVIKEFNKIHEQLAKNQNDIPLLVGPLKTSEAESILEKFLKAAKKEQQELKDCGECLNKE